MQKGKIEIVNKTYLSYLKSWKKILLFSFIVILFNSCLGFFYHHTKEKIIDDYYILATDVKSQATISIYKKNYESYIGITPEGIIEYAVIDNKLIVGKNKESDYFIIKIGEETFEKLNFMKYKEFLISKNIDVEKIKWNIF